MKAFLISALALVLALAGAADAFQPRVCNVQPAQSSYTHYVQPTNYTANGSYYQPYNHQVRKRIAVELIQVAQINPAYQASYVPDNYDSATQADLLAELRRINGRLDANAQARVSQTAELARLAEVLRALTQGKPAPAGTAQPPGPVPGGAAPVPPPTAPVPPPSAVVPKGGGGAAVGLAVMNAKCAVCHQSGKLAPDQRFTLLDAKGNLATLTDKQKLKIVLKTYTGAMPPPKNSAGVPPLTDEEVAAIIDAVQ